VTSETPIYDATCRDVGAPPDEASGPAVPPDDRSGELSGELVDDLADDAVTSDLFLPGGAHPPPGTGDR
jgi:hypothetical protein